MHKNQQSTFHIHPVIIAIIGLSIGILTVIILGLTGVLNFNPYGKDIRISNFADHFHDVPRNNRNELFANLYNIVKENTSDEKIKAKDAQIRDGSVVIRNYENDNLSYGEFIVDIPSLKQSYRGQFTWSPDPEKNSTLTDHNNLITCLATFDLTYGNFGCRDIVTDNPYYTLAGKYPILRSLPINVSKYNDDGSRSEYTITYRPNGNNTDITLVINDKTGNNLEPALEYLKNEGVDMENTKISYVDYKAFQELIDRGTEPDLTPVEDLLNSSTEPQPEGNL